MGKMLETKKKILSLLKRNNMTITELSSELGLSTATISQHLDELQKVGAIERVDNEHFKKLKYYKVREAVSINTNIAKYAIGALVLAIVASGVYFYSAQRHSNPQAPAVLTAKANSSSNSTQTAMPSIGGAFACPLITYNLNGTISGQSGFSLYYLNSSYGKIADYVLGSNSSGIIYASELVDHVMNRNNTQLNINRTHYAVLTQIGSRFNGTAPGVNVTIYPGSYNAVNSTTINFTVEVRTMDAAALTYWLRIDGPCGGGVPYVLVTVGSKPYSGTVTAPVNTYA